MILTLALALALLLQLPQGPVAPAPRAVDPPRLRIEPAGRVDLGSLGPTEPTSRLYQFRNTSPQPITLRVLDLSPGISVEGPALRGPIMPGGAAELTLRADPSGFVGWQARNVKLGTDDSRQGEYFLPVAMTVRPDLSVDALKKSLGEVGLHETPRLDFNFRRETGEATKLWISSALPPYLEAEVESVPALALEGGRPLPPPEQRGSTGSVKLTFRPGRLDPGVLTGLESLTVESSAPMQPRFQLYLDWKLRLPVKLSAPRLVFLDSKEREATLTIQPREAGGKIRIKRLALEGKGFRIPKVAPGSLDQLVLTVTRTAIRPAKAMLVLDLEGEPLPVRIPLSFLPPVKGKAAKLDLAPAAPPADHAHQH